MKKYGEIINPSDYYTICVDDWEAAAAAIVIISRGQYCIRRDDETSSPILIFGGMEKLDQFWMASFGHTFEEFIPNGIAEPGNWLRVADALDTVLIGRERAMLEELLEALPEDQRKARKMKYHDEHRSSMNDIGSICWSQAEHIRKTVAEKHGVPA